MFHYESVRRYSGTRPKNLGHRIQKAYAGSIKNYHDSSLETHRTLYGTLDMLQAGGHSGLTSEYKSTNSITAIQNHLITPHGVASVRASGFKICLTFIHKN
jgi:hypothetical protein